MRIGVLGGTFDPVHVGHLVLADEVRDRVGLDRVLFVPAARSPHKEDEPRASAADRIAMLETALAPHDAFEVDRIEIDRGGVSYTIETLEAIHDRHPDDEIVFLLGADGLPELDRWHRAPDLLREFSFVVATRPGYPLEAWDELRASLGDAVVERLRAAWVEIPLIGVSSTDIRARIRDGRTIRQLVPPGVEAIIRDRGIYARG